LSEATRVYTELFKLCPHLEYFDVGGGLAVDYDGSRTNFESSMNYSVEEYARDVVYAIGTATSEAGIPSPTIISESGRAMVAHHAVLVTQVIDTAPALGVVNELGDPPGENLLFEQLVYINNSLNVKNCQEALNDATILREEVLSNFVQGNIALAQRAWADRAYWHILAKVKELSKGLSYIPEDLVAVDDKIKDTYFCNFSLFQSLPDSWAVGNLFPIVPISGHTQEPKRRAVLADISCDSDGKIDKFVDQKEVKKYLQVHEVEDGKPYYLAIFLVGAYQETLGDLHNLFGDTNAVHVDLDSDNRPVLNHVVQGDTVREVLGYVEFHGHNLQESLRKSVERAVGDGELSYEEAGQIQRKYKDSLDNYTYLKL
jgi:arginine decarboxylase